MAINPTAAAAVPGLTPQAGTQKTGSDPAASFMDVLAKTNAPILAKREHQQKMDALMVKRVQEVGLAAYTREQAQVAKMMKILRFEAEYADDDMKEKLNTVIQHFKDNPPETVDDITRYMHDMEKAIPIDAPRNLKQRMKDMIDTITTLLNMPEADLAKVMAEAKKKLPGMGDA